MKIDEILLEAYDSPDHILTILKTKVNIGGINERANIAFTVYQNNPTAENLKDAQLVLEKTKHEIEEVFYNEEYWDYVKSLGDEVYEKFQQECVDIENNIASQIAKTTPSGGQE